jgi:hypothetical protein
MHADPFECENPAAVYTNVVRIDTPHYYSELYPSPNQSGQRRLVLTYLHKGCGGQVVAANPWLWKAVGLITSEHSTEAGCCLCHKQPLEDSEIYEDYC